MRRVMIGAAAVLCMLVTALGVTLLTSGSVAQSDRTIPVTAIRFNHDSTDAEGERCVIPLTGITMGFTPQQVVVTDESSSIVAIEDLAATWELTDDGDSLRCLVELAIPVPEAEFYTVWLGEQRLRGYAGDAFPVSDADAIGLSFD